MTETTTVQTQTPQDLGALFGTAGIENLPAVIPDTPSEAVLVDRNKMAPEALGRVDQIVQQFDLMNTSLVLMYGSDPQRKLSAFLDTLLEGIKVKDVDVAGEMVLQLSDGIKLMQLRKVKNQIQGQGGGFLAKLANAVGMGTNYLRAFYESQKAITEKMRDIEVKAKNQIGVLEEDIKKLDELVLASVEQIYALEIFVVAGEAILKREKAVYASKAEEVRASRNQIEASELRDMGRQLASFDVRLLRLKEAYVDAGSVTRERIREIQESGNIEIQNLNDGILFTVPKLKKVILQVAALGNIKSAQKSRRDMDAVDAQLDAELAETNSDIHTAAKESQGDALARVERLEAVITTMKQSIKNGVDIEKSTQEMRDQAAAKLIDLKDQITDALNEANLEAAAA